MAQYVISDEEFMALTNRAVSVALDQIRAIMRDEYASPISPEKQLPSFHSGDALKDAVCQAAIDMGITCCASKEEFEFYKANGQMDGVFVTRSVPKQVAPNVAKAAC